MLARVTRNPQDPQDPQDATICALTTTNVEHTSQTFDVWVLESEVSDDDFLDLDECFTLLVFFTLTVPLYAILFFAWINHAEV